MDTQTRRTHRHAASRFQTHTTLTLVPLHILTHVLTLTRQQTSRHTQPALQTLNSHAQTPSPSPRSHVPLNTSLHKNKPPHTSPRTPTCTGTLRPRSPKRTPSHSRVHTPTFFRCPPHPPTQTAHTATPPKPSNTPARPCAPVRFRARRHTAHTHTPTLCALQLDGPRLPSLPSQQSPAGSSLL